MKTEYIADKCGVLNFGKVKRDQEGYKIEFTLRGRKKLIINLKHSSEDHIHNMYIQSTYTADLGSIFIHISRHDLQFVISNGKS